ncbi:hypothetical protein BV25DRAFT_1513092 [Artomyces pyxidatus]|uniref:Uncharacterized protein n=1 Tax=Artomyces pyxidatus TaxID=48021 RepID=A0ACB8TCP8_9AGAM|nr:hypothetical protein BV25DRAFT_1513092 [Artomyces pyxidatus]
MAGRAGRLAGAGARPDVLGGRPPPLRSSLPPSWAPSTVSPGTTSFPLPQRPSSSASPPSPSSQFQLPSPSCLSPSAHPSSRTSRRSSFSAAYSWPASWASRVRSTLPPAFSSLHCPSPLSSLPPAAYRTVQWTDISIAHVM